MEGLHTQLPLRNTSLMMKAQESLNPDPIISFRLTLRRWSLEDTPAMLLSRDSERENHCNRQRISWLPKACLYPASEALRDNLKWETHTVIGFLLQFWPCLKQTSVIKGHRFLSPPAMPVQHQNSYKQLVCLETLTNKYYRSQWLERYLSTSGWHPSACKSNRFHVHILRFLFTKLRENL